jgi:hypothetical protein
VQQPAPAGWPAESKTPRGERGFFMLWTRRAVPPFYITLAGQSAVEFGISRGRPVELVALIDDVIPPVLRREGQESAGTIARYREACLTAGFSDVVFASDLKLTLSDLIAQSAALTLRDVKDVLPPYKSHVETMPAQEYAVLQFQHLLFRRGVDVVDASYVVFGRPWTNFVRLCIRGIDRPLSEVAFDHQDEPLPQRRDRGFLVGGRET